MFQWNEECYLYQRQNDMGCGWSADRRAPMAGTTKIGRRVRRQWIGAPVAWGAGGEAWTPGRRWQEQWTMVAWTMEA